MQNNTKKARNNSGKKEAHIKYTNKSRSKERSKQVKSKNMSQNKNLTKIYCLKV